MYYLINDILTPCEEETVLQREAGSPPYVAVLNPDTWQKTRDRFDMVIDIDMDPSNILETKAIVNYDSLTGAFHVPRRSDLGGRPHRFAFALDEKGIVFIETGEYAANIVRNIQRTKKWRLPSLERFLYDFLEKIIERDLPLLEKMEQELGRIEDEILDGKQGEFPERLTEIRGDLMDLRVHYEQMIDLGQELEENENGFFSHDNLRYFRLFTERVMRLQDQVTSLRDYTVQLRDLFSTQLDIRQNRIMTVLTVITAIFMPLTLIAGWYGMNFYNMPELTWKYGYLTVIIVSILIVILGIILFRKKKWL